MTHSSSHSRQLRRRDINPTDTNVRSHTGSTLSNIIGSSTRKQANICKKKRNQPVTKIKLQILFQLYSVTFKSCMLCVLTLRINILHRM